MDTESENFGLNLLILLAIFFWHLWRSLSRPPPQDRQTAENPGGDVLTLLRRAAAAPSAKSRPAHSTPGNGIAEPGSKVARGLSAIETVDHTFRVHEFLSRSRAAYETILTAFATGNRAVLANLLSKDVYEAFAAAIAEREARGDHTELRIVSVAEPEIVEAGMRGTSAQITLRFVSKIATTTRTLTGEIVAGDATEVVQVDDLWTFAREIFSRRPDWKLIATEVG